MVKIKELLEMFTAFSIIMVPTFLVSGMFFGFTWEVFLQTFLVLFVAFVQINTIMMMDEYKPKIINWIYDRFGTEATLSMKDNFGVSIHELNDYLEENGYKYYRISQRVIEAFPSALVIMVSSHGQEAIRDADVWVITFLSKRSAVKFKLTWMNELS